MKKYFSVFQISLQNIFEYRWNFLLGRFRQIILLLTLYFLWTTVFSKQPNLFGFNFTQIITYVFVVQILRGIVLDSRSENIADEISGNGKFFSYLLRPIGYFKYWLSVDLAYKVINIIFTTLELIIVAKILSVTLFFQTNLLNLLLFLSAVILATLMYFLLISWVSLVAFWMTQAWGARFALTLLLEFTSGAFFPLDILPGNWQQILNLTPFPYLIYFPVKVYLGQLAPIQMWQGFTILLFWLVALFFMARLTWVRGLKVYQAFGG